MHTFLRYSTLIIMSQRPNLPFSFQSWTSKICTLRFKSGKKSNPDANHYFRPFRSSQDDENNGEKINSQSLLWVHQEKWQRDILTCYGNNLSLIDATYKTTKYDVSLSFLCVRTNTKYMIVAEFIVQSESTESILEAINIIREWNPAWNPNFFSL